MNAARIWSHGNQDNGPLHLQETLIMRLAIMIASKYSLGQTKKRKKKDQKL